MTPTPEARYEHQSRRAARRRRGASRREERVMAKSFYFGSIVQMKKLLGNLDQWLEKSVAFAKAKNFDPNTLLQARLAPDQFPLVRQIQTACDQPKFAAARLLNREPPKNPDTETTIDEIRARIRTAIAHVETFKEADFVGCESRKVALPFLEGKVLDADEYITAMVVPNFYFHITHAYAILRHNGVDLGKMDYLGALNAQTP
jgi:hypothetical protein